MKLIEYLNKIDERANNPHDVDEPLVYVYHTQKRSTIDLDLSVWIKIKELALLNDKVVEDEIRNKR